MDKVAFGVTNPGGTLLASAGRNITIAAQQVDILEARQTSQSSTEQRSRQSGLSIGISSPLISAAQTGQQMVQAASNTGNTRTQALAAASAGLYLYNNAGSINQAVTALGSGSPAGAGSINLSLGSSQSQSTSSSQTDSARGSSVNAGNNLTIVASALRQAQDARGDGNLTVQGSQITAGNSAVLMADNQINLQAAQNTSSQRSANSSSSASVGVSISAAGPTFNASTSRGQGSGNGQETTYTSALVNAGNTVTLSSGGNTSLTGAVIAASTVNAQVGGNLTTQSLQDSSRYQGQQTSSGGSISVAGGVPIGGGISASRSNIDSSFQSTGQQSGIQAGSGGFQVAVQGNTSLQGGVIASTQTAVDANANRFTTGGNLTISDIQNTASYTGTAAGVSANAGIQGGQYGLSGVGAGVGSDRGSAASTTTAGISGIAGNTTVRTGDAQAGLQPIFDAARVQREVNAQTVITAEFGQQASSAWGTHANQMFVNAIKSGRDDDAKCWAPDGACRAGGHALIGGLTGGATGAVSAGASSIAAPHMQAFLISRGITPAAASAITQLSALGAGNALGGAAGGAAAINEAGNNAVIAIPLIVEGVIAGGAIAVRACLSSPACLNALRLGGTALVARVAATLTPEELSQIPGFGTGAPVPPLGPNSTGNSSPPPGYSGSTVTPGTQLETSNNTGGSQASNPAGNGTAAGGGFGAGGVPVVDPLTYAASPIGNTSPVNTNQGAGVSVTTGNGTQVVVLPPGIDARAAGHILVGDNPNSGGHLWPGQAGKTPFPKSWTPEKVLGEVSSVLTDPNSTRTPSYNNTTVISGSRGEVEIRVVISNANGRVVTAHPTNLPRNL